jgi:cadmium resistance protein CadD (predicted permease)
LNALPALIVAATAAYVSTNVDGYVLLLGFFSHKRYRAMEVATGQFVSVTLQVALSFEIMQTGYVTNAPFVGLAGIVPLIAGLRRIAALCRDGETGNDEAPNTMRATASLARIVAVVAVATSGAIDNVLMYASLLVGRTTNEDLFIICIFGVLTAVLCVCAFLTARSRRSMTALRIAAGRIAPFTTTAIGLSLLIRFDTLPWIVSLA